MTVYSERFLTRGSLADPLTLTEMNLGLTMLLIVFEVTRRTLGFGMLVIVSVLVIYAFFGNFIPGSFGHKHFNLMEFVDKMFYTVNGVFGSIVGACQITCPVQAIYHKNELPEEEMEYIQKAKTLKGGDLN